MSLNVDIEKKLGSFHLQVAFSAGDEPLALLGSSGCGKSMTLRCIAGILKPDSGKIILNGTTLFDSSAKINLPPQKRHIGYLFQQYALFPNMTVRQNIAAAIPEKKGRAEQTSEKLRQFHLEGVADQRPAQLSGGQQQRTALARILASQPDLILLDEPLSALDSYLRYQVELELMETLETFSGPSVWVSHDRGEVYRNCQKICVLDNGKSQGVCTRESLFHEPSTEAAARLSGCKNYVDAIPEEHAVFIPAWNLHLPCGKDVPDGTARIGIRANQLHFSDKGFPCTVIRTIEDIFSVILLLKPLQAGPDAPLLRMEIPKEIWEAEPRSASLSVAVHPDDILLLKE